MRLSRGRRWRGSVANALAVTAAVAFGPGPVWAAPGENDILGTGARDAIAGSYVVVLRDTGTTAARPAAAARSLAARYGGTVGHVYTVALAGFSIRTSVVGARRIAADPSVAYVEQDAVVRADGDQPDPPSWGLDRIDQPDRPRDNIYTYPTVASKVTAYVIDTGIRTSHSDFGGRASWGTNTTGDGNDTDCNGHGTHVAGTIGGTAHGVAKHVRLVAVKVLDCDGNGEWSGAIAGIDWVSAHHDRWAVANMSLGGERFQAANDAVTGSIRRGVTYAVSAGNTGEDACDFSPASTPGAITVGSIDSSDLRSFFSNNGPCLDLFAPGRHITSAWATGDTDTHTISGTSMASPHVAGAAALTLGMHPTFTPTQVRNAVVYAAGWGKVTNAGAGSPNRLLHTGLYGPYGNSTNVRIADRSTIYSSVTVTGLYAYVSPHAKVYVNIRHPYRGDLRLYLIAPDGSQYLLKWSDPADFAVNVIGTYTVNLSTEFKNGVWRLKVQDVVSGDTGHLDAWAIWV